MGGGGACLTGRVYYCSVARPWNTTVPVKSPSLEQKHWEHWETGRGVRDHLPAANNPGNSGPVQAQQVLRHQDGLGLSVLSRSDLTSSSVHISHYVSLLMCQTFHDPDEQQSQIKTVCFCLYTRFNVHVSHTRSNGLQTRHTHSQRMNEWKGQASIEWG